MMNRLPIPDALAKLNDLGYDAYEMFNWRDPKVLDTFLVEAPKYPNLACACIVANKGVTAQDCGLVNPKERDQFLKEMESAIEIAKKFKSTRLGHAHRQRCARHVARSDDGKRHRRYESHRAHAGKERHHGGHRSAQHLRQSSGLLSLPVRDAAKLVDAVGSPNVKILFDIYHVQIMEGNLIPLIRQEHPTYRPLPHRRPPWAAINRAAARSIIAMCSRRFTTLTSMATRRLNMGRRFRCIWI
jgi:hydroxypyruvate isomerase